MSMTNVFPVVKYSFYYLIPMKKLYLETLARTCTQMYLLLTIWFSVVYGHTKIKLKV